MGKITRKIKYEKEYTSKELRELLKLNNTNDTNKEYYKDIITKTFEDENWQSYPYLNSVIEQYNPSHYIGKRYHKIEILEISDKGRVRVKCKNEPERILEQKDDIKKGYLRLPEFPGFGYVYRLVADTWLEKTDGKNIVHHIDNNGFNNSVENLIWVGKGEHYNIHSKN